MHLPRHRLQHLSLIALLAIFGLVFAPTISHALAQGASQAALNGSVEICTPQGLHVIAIAAESAANDTASAVDPAGADMLPVSNDHSSCIDHCAMCGLAARMSLCLPSPVALWRGNEAATASYPASEEQPLHSGIANVGAQPRAPPILG